MRLGSENARVEWREIIIPLLFYLVAGGPLAKLWAEPPSLSLAYLLRSSALEDRMLLLPTSLVSIKEDQVQQFLALLREGQLPSVG